MKPAQPDLRTLEDAAPAPARTIPDHLLAAANAILGGVAPDAEPFTITLSLGRVTLSLVVSAPEPVEPPANDFL